MQGKMAEPEDRRKVQSRAGQKPGQTARNHQKRTARQKRQGLQKRQRDRRDRICGTRQRDRKTGSVEKETQQDSTDSAESSSQIDDTAASESAEQKPESTSAENEGQNRQDGSGAENQADAASVAADAGNQTPTLTLEKAAQLAQDDEAAKDKLKVDANTVTITVTDGIGLILLSNVKPSEYKKYTINLVTTSGWDLTGTAEIKGQTYSFLGLGDDADPYEGKFEFDKKQ